MTRAFESLSSFSFEPRIISAKNVETVLTGNFFIRLHLSAGNKRRIRLNSREISSQDDLFWDESFALECTRTEESIHHLKEEGLEFELRAQISWENVFQSPDMRIQTWLPVTSLVKSGPLLKGAKPPALLVAIKVRVSALIKTERRKFKETDECGCTTCTDAELFALAAALGDL
ncbi:hypothetical protein Nepgr_027158 [Nepenthes gracilis]|uniref:C2 NT-type domain-containing protein n=1 Tax=Nepenthes gracilis TaxID=150966 RepID=A0AAD3T9E2_NEPGR|nr:hypothetical protein Nepgr_027158 [Nepenthes gracilis]